MKARNFLAAAALFTCTLSGCSARVKTVTNLPAGVTQAQAQAWDSEVATLDKIATATSAVRQAVIGLEKAGAFPDTVAYVKALQTVAKIDQAELAASAYLKQQPEYFGVPQKAKVQGLLNDISSQIQGLNVQTLVGIKDANSQKQLSTVVAELTNAVNIALALVN
jgi:hypothetical protein